MIQEGIIKAFLFGCIRMEVEAQNHCVSTTRL
jgi:hypothetical protein